MPRLTAIAFPLLAASVAAWPPFFGPGTEVPMGHCTEGYGLFRCTDAINCTAITGEVSCCESPRKVLESKLSKGRCGLRLNEARRTCLTSIVCSPHSTRYEAVFPVSRFHPKNPGFFSATHATTGANSTVREPQTQTATLRAIALLTTSYATTYTTASPPIVSAGSPSILTTVSSSTLTTAIVIVSPQSSNTAVPSLTFDDIQDHKPMERGTIGGTVVGVIAGGSLLILVLYLLFRRWKTHRDNCNLKNRGVLPGPRLPTGSTVAASVYRRDESVGWHTPPKSESSHLRDPETNDGQDDIGLQYDSESAPSQTDGPASPKDTVKERFSALADDKVTPSGSPSRHSHAPTSPPWPAENERSTLYSRRSNATIDWPLPKSTVSSPALLMNAREPPAISPLSPLSPFADFDRVKAEVEQHIETEQHRQDAYKKLSGEVSDDVLTKKLGSVSRERQDMVGTQEAPKKLGSVARARQNIEAARGAREQPRREIEARQNTGGLRDFIRELDAQCGDEEANETGTVIRRKSKRAY